MTKQPVHRTDCVSAKGQFLVGHVKNSSLLNCRTFFILCLEDKNSRDESHIDYIGMMGFPFRKQEDCMRKKVALLLTAAMAMSLLAGCGSDSVSGENNAADITAGVSEDGTVDPRFKYEEPVTLTSYFEISPAITNWNQEEMLNCVYYQRQEEETNITIDWQWFAQQTENDSVQKKSVAIASGEIPDFMVVNSSQLSLLAKSDLINKNLGEVFEKYASDELMAWTTGEGTAALESATYDGKVIAIPLVDSSIDSSDMMWIRRDWLNKLNLEAPATMEELYDVMIAFRDQDPDGNGKDDTIGMVFHNNFLSAGLGDGVGLFNGFGAYPTAWVEDGNGGLKYGSVAEENITALDYLAKMYQEGLIESDFASNDEVAASEPAASGKAGIQYGMLWNCNWPLNATAQNDIEADWVAVPIPSGTGEEAKPQIAVKINGYVVVNKNCEHPEAVVRLLNFWVDKSYYSGEEYNDYLIDDGTGVLTLPQHFVMLKTWLPTRNLEIHQHVSAAMESGDPSGLTAEELIYYEDTQKYLSGDILGGYGGMKTFGNDMSGVGVIEYYYENDLFQFNKFTTAPTPTMGSKMSTITDKVMEYYTKVIMGEASTADFDSFVNELNALGLGDITKEVNEWYSSK